ncbi:MAG: hypothetical protein WAT91_15475, partial [Saprospiraceae bacterium]
TVVNDKIFLKPIFPIGLDDIWFKLEKRSYPIEVNYPAEVSMIFNLKLPDGYIVESLPEPAKISNSTGGLQFSYDAVYSADNLKVTLKYLIKQLIFEPEEYSTLKSIYVLRKEKFNRQIVLTKS